MLNSEVILPLGYYLNGWHAGIKKNQDRDFGFIFSEVPANAYAVFTQNKFVGNPIIVGRDHIKEGIIQCVIVNSGNSNVATGKEGLELAYHSCKWTADVLKISEKYVLPSSTGVIGRKLNPSIIQKACLEIPNRMAKEPKNFSEAIMTTDQFPKIETQKIEKITITGFAKGAGMIHPNMATMLSYIITDAEISKEDIQNLTHFIANKTFNRISVDSDTSTSDTFLIMANGLSGERLKFPIEELEKLNYLNIEIYKKWIDYGFNIYEKNFEEMYYNLKQILNLDDLSLRFLIKLFRVSYQLAKKIIMDGEGTTKIFRVMVINAKTREVAKKIGNSVITSPLVKTAIFGGDPNWGRLIMAIGKIEGDFSVDHLQIYCNSLEVYPNLKDLQLLEKEMKKKEILIDIFLNEGDYYDSFLGCDLNYDYVKLNSEYTT